MFSVIIPLYNKSYGIVRAIESVLNQNHVVEYEIVIVNDGSTDDSILKIQKYLKKTNIKLINQKNSGVSVARNVGINNAKYNLICFLDADDWWESNFFSTLSNLIISYPVENFFLMGYQKVINNQIKPVVLCKKIKIYDKFGMYFLNTRGLVTPSIVVRKEILIEEGLFPEGVTLSEDLYLWSKIISKYSVVYNPIIVSNILFEIDESRGNRFTKTPYVLDFYAKNKYLSVNLSGFLKYIYLAHLYQSFKINDYQSWKKRWVVGLGIFPFFSIFFIFMGLIIILRKRFGNDKTK